MTSVVRRIADKAVLHLVKMWLKVAVEEKDERGRPRRTGGKGTKQGTPQGGVISPLLAKWLVGMKLALNDSKTCIRDARREAFRFLGYELGPQVNKRVGRRYLGARPSKRAMKQARERVSEILWRGRTERWEIIREELNRFLRGWAGYFAYDSHWPSFQKLDQHIWGRARNFLRRRFKLPSGTARFNYAEVFHNLGVLEMKRLLH